MNYLKSIRFGVMLPALAALAISSPLKADREGTRGGGRVVKTSRGYALVHLDACDPRSGESVLADNPVLIQELGKIAEYDWYLAFNLERTLKEREYCFSNELLDVVIQDDPECSAKYTKPAPPSGSATTQGAIYTPFDGIWIDGRIYANMASPSERAGLLIHEALHEYVPWTCDHYERLGMIENRLRQIRAGQPVRRVDYLAARRKSIAPLAYSEEAQAQRDYLSLILGDPARLRERLLQTLDPAALIEDRPTPAGLLDKDRSALDQLRSDYYGNLFQPYCDAKDEELVSHLAERVSKAFDIASICLARPSAAADGPYRRFLIDHLSTSLLSPLFGALADKGVSSPDGMILVSASVADISAPPRDGRENVQIIQLKPLSDWSSLPTRTRDAVEVIEQIASAGQTERVLQLTVRDPRFHAALSIIEAEKQIDAQEIHVEREKAMAKAKLKAVFSRFVSRLIQRLPKTVGDELAKEIDWSRLGYDLKGDKK